QNNPLYKDAEQINQLAISGSNLTKQLLAFSRRQTTHPEIFDLNEVLLRMDSIIRKMIGEAIELVTVPSLEPALVRMDPGQFEQVLLNLVTNARDAMQQKGKIIIKAELTHPGERLEVARLGPSPKEYVVLRMQDNGQGMTEEVKKRIFEPFFTTKEEGKGVGLGLATVYEIIKQAEGEIIVDSLVGQGTTFKIYFPRVEKPAGTKTLQSAKLQSPVGKERVLLVEDEPLVKHVSATGLRLHGYEVIEASNGSEALHWIEENKGIAIHLLLTDVVMPQIGGKELAKKVLALYPNIKILFTSGYMTDFLGTDREFPAHAGFIQKPYTPTMLCQKVRDVLDSK
ncbi:MAG TPA: ATP-binding protein, partial [Candidatus Omnitrophota bacterium]|nr:ATP-binding protein [Candidatus Omnitrophota bacterium]